MYGWRACWGICCLLIVTCQMIWLISGNVNTSDTGMQWRLLLCTNATQSEVRNGHTFLSVGLVASRLVVASSWRIWLVVVIVRKMRLLVMTARRWSFRVHGFLVHSVVGAGSGRLRLLHSAWGWLTRLRRLRPRVPVSLVLVFVLLWFGTISLEQLLQSWPLLWLRAASTSGWCLWLLLLLPVLLLLLLSPQVCLFFHRLADVSTLRPLTFLLQHLEDERLWRVEFLLLARCGCWTAASRSVMVNWFRWCNVTAKIHTHNR